MKDRRLITLSSNVTEDIKLREHTTGFNFSAWVEEAYHKEKMSEEGLKRELEIYESQVKICKNKLRYAKQKRLLFAGGLNEYQDRFIQESLKLITNNPDLFNGRLRLWNNNFKDKPITALQFRELIQREN